MELVEIQLTEIVEQNTKQMIQIKNDLAKKEVFMDMSKDFKAADNQARRSYLKKWCKVVFLVG